MSTNKPQYLIVHTEASPIITNAPRFDVVNQFHRQRGFTKSSLGWYVGYHYFIEKSGKLIQSRLDSDEGCHTIGYNLNSLGICMAGNADEEWPTKEQIETLRTWLKEKSKIYSILPENIKPHRNLLPLFTKTCYGSLLPDDWARNLIKEPMIVSVTNNPEYENLKTQVSLLQKLIELWKKLLNK